MPAPALSAQARPHATPLRLVNPEFGHSKASLIGTTTRGYIYVGASVHSSTIPVVLPDGRRGAFLRQLKRVASKLRAIEDVVAVDFFRAIVMPPTARFSAYLKERADSLRPANFDIEMLIQTSSVAAIGRLQTQPAYAAVIQMLQHGAERLYVMPARNVRRIGDVETSKDGLFLFNHFVADNRDVMLELWDYLAGWYVAETGLRTSVALMPIAARPGDYTIVNWARWDEHPLRHFWHQLSKRSFWKYVTANLDANHAASMPVYCRLA